MTVDEHAEHCQETEGVLVEALEPSYRTVRCRACGALVMADAGDERMRIAVAAAPAERPG